MLTTLAHSYVALSNNLFAELLRVIPLVLTLITVTSSVAETVATVLAPQFVIS
jgi:hypothetical protein